PAARELILTAAIHPERVDRAGALIAVAPEQFGPADEAGINRALERAIPHGRVEREQLRREVGPGIVVPVRERPANIEVGRFGDVAIASDATHPADLAPLVRL